LKVEISGFLCNSFLSAGRMDYANKIIKEIKINFQKNTNKELKGHYLKLEAHIFSNSGKFKKANSLYSESLEILDLIKSKYYNEVLFYLYINLFLDRNLSEDTFNNRQKKLKNDKYKILIEIIELVIKKDGINDSLIKKINDITRIQNKSYAFWFLSQYYSNNNKINESYDYETKAQDFLELCSNNISDIDLQEDFKKNILLHKKILSESSVKIDDLFDFSNDDINDENLSNSLNSNIFNFCIECGIENINNTLVCFKCKTDLKKDAYH
jgi:hypothetical protein